MLKYLFCKCVKSSTNFHKFRFSAILLSPFCTWAPKISFSILYFPASIITYKPNKSNESDMNRVLSYQTAMQINDDRDIRTYITKRTCVSLIFSSAFFTLIIGEQKCLRQQRLSLNITSTNFHLVLTILKLKNSINFLFCI